VNRDDAVRVVAEALHVVEYPLCQGGPRWHTEDAEAIVTALVAAGWGDLAAERERLAAAVRGLDRPVHGVTAYTHGFRDGYKTACDHAAHLIRADRCPVCRHTPHASLGFCPNLASDNDCDCTVRETPEETPEVWVDVPDDAPAYCNYPECDCPGGKVCAP